MGDSQGKAANDHGDNNIRAVGDMLKAHGFDEVTLASANLLQPEPVRLLGRAIRENMLLPLPHRVFACNAVVCRGLHGAPFGAHYLVWQDQWPAPLAVMCKAQNSSGSAVEKLEYLYATVHERFPCRAVVILDGTAFTPPVLARARHWVGKSNGKLARVFGGLSEFRCWLTDGGEYPPTHEPVLGLT